MRRFKDVLAFVLWLALLAAVVYGFSQVGTRPPPGATATPPPTATTTSTPAATPTLTPTAAATPSPRPPP